MQSLAVIGAISIILLIVCLFYHPETDSAIRGEFYKSMALLWAVLVVLVIAADYVKTYIN